MAYVYPRAYYACLISALWLLLLGQVGGARAQAPAWQLALSGNNNQPTTGTSRALATAVDTNGNVYITGSFTGQVTFGHSLLISNGYNDVFVAKWNTAAAAWAWGVSGGGNGDDVGYGIAVNGSNVYVTGSAESNASIAGTSLTTTGMFVAKYIDAGVNATNGWATSASVNYSSSGYGVAVSGSSVYVTGSFTSNRNVRIAGQLLNGAGGQDMFLAKYTDNGTSPTGRWAISGGGNYNDTGLSVAVSATSLYVTGSFESGTNAHFAGQAVAGAGDTDVFVAKYIDNGNVVSNGWAASGGGPNKDMGRGLAVSGSSVYVTGSFTSAAGTRFAGQTLAGNGAQDMFVAKYTDGGTSVSSGWATSGGGTDRDEGLGIAASGGSVYVTGFFTSASGTRIAGQSLAGAGSEDLFVAKYTDGGTSVSNGWATSGGGRGYDSGQGVALSGNNVYIASLTGDMARFGAAPELVSPGSAGVLGQLQTSSGAWHLAAAPLLGTYSVAMATAVDASGDVYVTGYYEGQIGFGPTQLTSQGETDVFVAKWNTAAAAWAWAVTGGGASRDYAFGIAVSGSNVYVTGTYVGSPLGTGPAARFAGQTLAGAGSGDVFIAKYIDNGGTVSNGWATSGGGYGSDYGRAIAVSGNNVYVTGNFDGYGNMTIAGQYLTSTYGRVDLFVAKYVDNGVSVGNGWATSGGGGDSDDYGYGIAVSGSNVYVTGIFASDTNTKLAGQALPGAGRADAFLAKYTDHGTSVSNGWAISGGGAGSDYGQSIAVSGSSVYVTGSFESGANARFAGQTLAGAGNADLFVAKYTDAGASVASGWAVSGGGTAVDVGQSIAVNSSNVYVTGFYTSNTNARFAGQALTGAGSADVFVAKYTDTGASAANGWALSGGGSAYDTGQGVALSGSRVYVVGTANPVATFGSYALNNPVATVVNFLARVDDRAAVPTATLTTSSQQVVTLFPNPARQAVTLAGAPVGVTVELCDALGRIVGTYKADRDGNARLALPANLVPGVYIVRFDNRALRLLIE
jgi:hypothetical protein